MPTPEQMAPNFPPVRCSLKNGSSELWWKQDLVKNCGQILGALCYLLGQHKCPRRLRDQFRDQSLDYLRSDTYQDFVKRVKYLLTFPMARYLRCPEPKEPFGLKPLRFVGSFGNWISHRFRDFGTSNTHLFFSWLQCKRAALPVNLSFVQDALEKHRATLSFPDAADLPDGHDRVKKILNSPLVKRYLKRVRREVSGPLRGVGTVNRISQNASLFASKNEGGQGGELKMLFAEEEHLPWLQNDYGFSRPWQFQEKISRQYFEVCQYRSICPKTRRQPSVVPGLLPGVRGSRVTYYRRRRVNSEGVPLALCGLLLSPTSLTKIVHHPHFGPIPVYEPNWFRDFLDWRSRQHPELDQGLPAAKIWPVCEPLKVRVISKGPALLYSECKGAQVAIHKGLRSLPEFRNIGRPFCPTDLLDISVSTRLLEMQDPHWFSGDMTNATDACSTELARTLLQEIWPRTFSGVGEPEALWNPTLLARCDRALCHHEMMYPVPKVPKSWVDADPETRGDPEEWDPLPGESRASMVFSPTKSPRETQQRGHLMGSIMSFPLLCLWNMCVFLTSWEESTINICPRCELLREIRQTCLLPGAGEGAFLRAQRAEDLPCECSGKIFPASQWGDPWHHVLINGDDILFMTDGKTGGLAGEYVRQLSELGVSASVGKTYVHKTYANINSGCMHLNLDHLRDRVRENWVDDGFQSPWSPRFGWSPGQPQTPSATPVEIPYLNLGLFLGQHKVQDRVGHAETRPFEEHLWRDPHDFCEISNTPTYDVLLSVSPGVRQYMYRNPEVQDILRHRSGRPIHAVLGKILEGVYQPPGMTSRGIGVARQFIQRHLKALRAECLFFYRWGTSRTAGEPRAPPWRHGFRNLFVPYSLGGLGVPPPPGLRFHWSDVGRRVARSNLMAAMARSDRNEGDFAIGLPPRSPSFYPRYLIRRDLEKEARETAVWEARCLQLEERNHWAELTGGKTEPLPPKPVHYDDQVEHCGVPRRNPFDHTEESQAIVDIPVQVDLDLARIDRGLRVLRPWDRIHRGPRPPPGCPRVNLAKRSPKGVKSSVREARDCTPGEMTWHSRAEWRLINDLLDSARNEDYWSPWIDQMWEEKNPFGRPYPTYEPPDRQAGYHGLGYCGPKLVPELDRDGRPTGLMTVAPFVRRFVPGETILPPFRPPPMEVSGDLLRDDPPRFLQEFAVRTGRALFVAPLFVSSRGMDSPRCQGATPNDKEE